MKYNRVFITLSCFGLLLVATPAHSELNREWTVERKAPALNALKKCDIYYNKLSVNGRELLEELVAKNNAHLEPNLPGTITIKSKKLEMGLTGFGERNNDGLRRAAESSLFEVHYLSDGKSVPLLDKANSKGEAFPLNSSSLDKLRPIDGNTVTAIQNDQTIGVWDLSSGRKLMTLSTDFDIVDYHASFKNGKLDVVAVDYVDGGNITQWSVPKLMEKAHEELNKELVTRTKRGLKGEFVGMTVANDGKHIVTLARNGRLEMRTSKNLGVAASTVIPTPAGSEEKAFYHTSVLWLPRTEEVMALTEDGTIRVFKREGKRLDLVEQFSAPNPKGSRANSLAMEGEKILLKFSSGDVLSFSR